MLQKLNPLRRFRGFILAETNVSVDDPQKKEYIPVY